MLKGIDISFPSQPDPLRMAKVKAEGATFVVQRVTRGVYVRHHPEAGTRIRAIRKAGLVAGASHVLTRVEEAGKPLAWNSGIAQCDAFVAELPDRDPEGLICRVDWEKDDGGAFTFDGAEFEPDRRGASWQELREFVRRWFVLFPRHPLFLYTREGYAVRRSEGHDVMSLNPGLRLWDANLVRSGTPALGRDIDDAQVTAFEEEVADAGRPAWTHVYAGFSRPIVWQFGGFGIADYNAGIKVDGSLFRGARARLEEHARSATTLRVLPVAVGRVESLADERLRAAISLGTGGGRVDLHYEIRLMRRSEGAAPEGQAPIWIGKGVPTESEPIDDDDDEDDDDPSLERPKPPHFESLDGCPVVAGMMVASRSPTVRLSTDDRVDAFRWKLLQDDEVVESQRLVTDGIVDGRSITFAQTFKLRRGRPNDETALKQGEFLFPFERGIRYRSETYAGHSNFAVDFNRQDRQDAKEWIYAPAAGKVQHVFRGERANLVNGLPSELYISHAGLFQTVFAHMTAIQVSKGDRVVAGQKLGRVSNVGAPGGPHLHLQVRRRAAMSTPVKGGRPIRMALGGETMIASIGDSDFRPASWEGKFGQVVSGVGPARKQVAPELRVSVRRAADQRWSKPRRLQFIVGKAAAKRAGCSDPGGDEPDTLGGKGIDHVYDGPELPAGRYVLRYLVFDDVADDRASAADRSLEITG